MVMMALNVSIFYYFPFPQVRLNEESMLLENNNAGLSDSDDDNILL